MNDQNCCQNIPVKDIVRVVEIPPFVNIFHRFPGLKLTLKCIEKFRTRNGMKKRIIKSYTSINFPSEVEFARWKKILRSVAKKNSIRRRTRRQQRIDRKEKLRLEIRAKRDAAKLRRKEMLASAVAETRKRNKEKALLFRKKREAARERKRQREVERGIEENRKQIALKEALEMEHLVDQAERFLNELQEAKDAVSKAQYLTKYSDLDSEDQSHSDNTSSSDGEEFWGDKGVVEKPNEMYFIKG